MSVNENFFYLYNEIDGSEKKDIIEVKPIMSSDENDEWFDSDLESLIEENIIPTIYSKQYLDKTEVQQVILNEPYIDKVCSENNINLEKNVEDKLKVFNFDLNEKGTKIIKAIAIELIKECSLAPYNLNSYFFGDMSNFSEQHYKWYASKNEINLTTIEANVKRSCYNSKLSGNYELLDMLYSILISDDIETIKKLLKNNKNYNKEIERIRQRVS